MTSTDNQQEPNLIYFRPYLLSLFLAIAFVFLGKRFNEHERVVNLHQTGTTPSVWRLHVWQHVLAILSNGENATLQRRRDFIVFFGFGFKSEYSKILTIHRSYRLFVAFC